jgi:uncharacterized membrane-anchored protein YhcB (DUF1043 family)
MNPSAYALRMSPVADSEPDLRNPYSSPAAAADARGKLGWLVMLLLLWPTVMAAVGCIIGFFLGRLTPEGVDPRLWNPGVGALAGAALLAVIGVVIGIRKATRLRRRLDEIHARRQELRFEMERRRAQTDSSHFSDQQSDQSDLAPGGAP